MHKKNMVREPAEPTLQRAHNAREEHGQRTCRTNTAKSSQCPGRTWPESLQEPTLQSAHTARHVKAQHDLSTTKLTLHKHLLQTAKCGYADTRDV